MENFTLSYREVIPDLSAEEDWNEITLNTGATQSTLQDIKVAEKAGGFCYKNATNNHIRNRFIYWRTYQDILELSEVSLDFNLYQSNVRYKFTDSPVLSLTITELEDSIVILVTTVCSLHRIKFSHPNVLAGKHEISDTQSFSIFRDASTNAARDPSTFYVIGQNTSSTNPVPHAAASFLSPNGEEAYFALAYQNQLTLYLMNCHSGQTLVHILKEHYIMPRLFSNLKGALIGKSNSSDAEYANSLVFTHINGHIFLVALYRDDQLRMWSTTSLQNVCSISCIREGAESRMQGPQTNALRKINDTTLCAFLSHSMGSEFVCIEINSDGASQYYLTRKKIISAPQSDLADFDASESRIWALWCNAEGEFSISNFCLQRGTGINWVSAAMEPPPDRYCVGVEQGMDPREAYCSYVFRKFERQVVTKALFMFRRSSVRFDSKLSIIALKEQVCQAVEDEIQNEVKDFDISDDEYLEISTRLWERFYSCCEQYHIKACQPIGLLILDPIDALCIVKKNTFSMLRPCETLEHLMVSGDSVEMDNVIAVHFAGNEQVGEDLVNLVAMLAQIEQWLPEDVKMDLDKKLYQLEMPNVLMGKLVDEILAGDQDREILPNNFIVTIRQKIQAISDLRTPMAMLLDNLRMDNGSPESMQTHSGLTQSSRFLLSIGGLFGSHIGISVLSESVRQMSLISFALCRNLLILQQILIDTCSLSPDILETIRSQFMPDTVIFLQSYYVMVWICETPVNLAACSTLDSSIQRLNMLQFTNGSPKIFLNGGKNHSAPLLRIFLSSKGLYTALALYGEGCKTLKCPQWQQTLIPLVRIISQLIWAVSFNFTFGEWLFSTCQHIIVEDYVRLLNSWCEWNVCSRQFILAVSLLDNGETHKAYDLFLQSAKGVLTEQFMREKILKSTDEELTHNQAIARYYLKVIQLFEQHNALDHIISMAQVAIGILDKNDPQLPMFQSIVFNNHLILEHYEEAYHSLIYNAELSRRKDCLRQLVVTLFNKKRLDLLMHFPYVGLHDEFENIVESRARSLAIDDNEIYDFLYAFHVNNGNMRKASSVMYEQAMRLHLESDSIEAMKKRCSCLLVCINSLHLIDTRYRWIAKPVIGDEYASNSIANENMETDEAIGKEQVVVLEIKDIRKELLQTESLIVLSEHRKDLGAFLHAGSQELIVILANSGLFTPALKLAKGFGHSVLPVFDSLTAACVRTADENPNDAWSWLQENDLADLPHRSSAADMAWSLLQKLVEDNEEEDSTLIRKSVVNKLLSLNAFVPQWLYSAYKAANSSELLRLFVNHSRLLEATELAKEITWAMLGAGSEYFDFKRPIAVTNREMCLPLQSLDLLLHGLKLNSDLDVEYKQAHTELDELIQTYINTAVRTSDDKIQMAYQMERDRQKQRY
ncbi:nuclear pore complex protein Nup160 homolog [Episyrphus balteatus]|uniref:nuclear pore complex protein Nup160 homolog n=1 Tax=Episyrphus balteatus TaxID=286459 RepID=UPI002486766D|nr:nuclear pore complex protein Nup160 homolog [Episyrphus balteatus]